MNERRRREQKTLDAMIGMYCAHHHGGQAMCAECAALSRYAQRRLARCVFGEDKPTCANCTVHCYKAEMRAKVRSVMRWSGPRMILRHPWLALLHRLDGLRPAPRLPHAPRA